MAILVGTRRAHTMPHGAMIVYTQLPAYLQGLMFGPRWLQWPREKCCAPVWAYFREWCPCASNICTSPWAPTIQFSGSQAALVMFRPNLNRVYLQSRRSRFVFHS